MNTVKNYLRQQLCPPPTAVIQKWSRYMAAETKLLSQHRAADARLLAEHLNAQSKLLDQHLDARASLLSSFTGQFVDHVPSPVDRFRIYWEYVSRWPRDFPIMFILTMWGLSTVLQATLTPLASLSAHVHVFTSPSVVHVIMLPFPFTHSADQHSRTSADTPHLYLPHRANPKLRPHLPSPLRCAPPTPPDHRTVTSRKIDFLIPSRQSQRLVQFPPRSAHPRSHPRRIVRCITAFAVWRLCAGQQRSFQCGTEAGPQCGAGGVVGNRWESKGTRWGRSSVG